MRADASAAELWQAEEQQSKERAWAACCVARPHCVVCPAVSLTPVGHLGSARVHMLATQVL